MKTFEDVVAGRVDCYKIWEDERHVAILNPSPVRPGHTLVLPKRLCDYVFELEASEYLELWEAVRIVALQIQRALACARVCIAVVGWEVRHVHVHLIPTDTAGEFPPLPGKAASRTELESMLRRLTKSS